MRATGFAAALTIGATLAASGAQAQQYGLAGGTEIRIKCDRYMSRRVIWDEPAGFFIDDLEAAGYSNLESLALATTICRDENLVGKPESLGPALIAIMAKNPPRR